MKDENSARNSLLLNYEAYTKRKQKITITVQITGP
jgi:hypothetical protein